MRHFIILFCVFMAVFALWKAIAAPERRQATQAARKYGWPIVAAAVVLLIGLVAAFYGRAVNLL